MNLKGIVIRAATKNDENAIRRLWMDCFDDDNSYLDLYFQHHTNFEQIILLQLQSKVIGMIHQLPCKVLNGNDAYYWYAVGIDSNFRQKGYFKCFCSQVLQANQKRGFSNICQPVRGLERIYQKLGFCFPYWAEEASFFGDTKSGDMVDILEANPSDFGIISQEQGSVQWDWKHIEYALTENRFCGGMNLKFRFQDKDYVFMAIKKDDYYLLDHTNLTPDIATVVQSSIKQKLGWNRFVLRYAANRESTKRFVVGLSDDPAVTDSSQITFTLA